MITQAHCATCHAVTPHNTGNLLRLFDLAYNATLTVLTLGLWFPFWLIESLSIPDSECTKCKTTSHSTAKRLEIAVLSVVFGLVLLVAIPIVLAVVRFVYRIFW